MTARRPPSGEPDFVQQLLEERFGPVNELTAERHRRPPPPRRRPTSSIRTDRPDHPNRQERLTP